MKIERINDNQIRCILTQGDLIKRHLTLKKLMPGSNEARQLFHDMLEQSYEEVGFEPNEYPLLVEAQLMHEGTLALTITKVNSPEELPGRQAQQAEELLKAFRRILEMARPQEAEDEPAEKKAEPLPDLNGAFCFTEEQGIILPPSVKKDPAGVSTSLFFAEKPRCWYLHVSAPGKAGEAFGALCHLLSEYGRPVPTSAGTKPYYQEHYTCIFARNALKHLADGEAALPKTKKD